MTPARIPLTKPLISDAVVPETSFEFIESWFVKAKHEAKKQAQHDSAKLWEDGVEHLSYYKDLSDKNQETIKELVETLIHLKHNNHHTIEEEMWKIDQSLSKAKSHE